MTLRVATRGFVQGAPPIPKKDIDKQRKRYLLSSHEDEMKEKYEQRQQHLHEYFSTHEPNCPEPLAENAFVKGKFGMRRRWFIDRRDQINPTTLGDALGDSTNAMRK